MSLPPSSPGTGSGTEHHGNYPLPVPLRLPRPSVLHLVTRFLEITLSLVRRFAPLLLKKILGREVSESEAVRPLRDVFQDLGSTFLKLGQLIGSAPGLFGDTVSAEFRSCLDQAPPVPFEEVKRIVETDLGRPIDVAFADFDREPIAAASIAVVHEARLPDGCRVAVKILRPGIEEQAATDFTLMVPLVNSAVKLAGAGVAGPLRKILAGFREQVAEELDLRNESKAIRHHLRMLEDVEIDRIVIPEPVEELSGRRVLTMTFIDGVPIDDLTSIERLGVDPRPVIEEVVRAWFVTTIRNGTFHGDVHAGNLLLMPEGKLGVVDWGIVGRLDAETHGFFRAIVRASLGYEDAWETIVAHIEGLYGPVLREGLGLDDAAIDRLVRMQVSGILQRPFGEVKLSDLVMLRPEEMALKAKAGGTDGEAKQGGRGSGSAPGQAHNVRGRIRTFLEHRRRRQRVTAIASESGMLDAAGDRGMFLLGKQLLYFERYGKMYLSDVSLLEDRDFFVRVLDEPPLAG